MQRKEPGGGEDAEPRRRRAVKDASLHFAVTSLTAAEFDSMLMDYLQRHIDTDPAHCFRIIRATISCVGN